MSGFVHRVLPGVMLQKLPYEGHFTYFYFCDECHRQMFTTVYGNPQGPLPAIPTGDGEEKSEVFFSDVAKDKDNASCLAWCNTVQVFGTSGQAPWLKSPSTIRCICWVKWLYLCSPLLTSTLKKTAEFTKKFVGSKYDHFLALCPQHSNFELLALWCMMVYCW